MLSPNHSWSRILLIILNVSFIVLPARAQFWHVLPPLSDTDAISAGFSNDQKKVFFIRRDNGVANIWSTVIMDKYGGIVASPKGPLTQVTKFTDRGVVRFFHLLNRPEILFMRATDNGKDFHIYRIKDDASEQPQDVTPGGDGVTNIIIGASYNGRYVYYSSNALHQDKVDCYRYDTQQLMTDLIFPNDKDYEVLAWTRDQTKLLVEDSSANSFMMYDIETTDRTPLTIPPGVSISSVGLDPHDSGSSTGYKLGYLGFKIQPAPNVKIDSNKAKDQMQNASFDVDFSQNGTYRIVRNHTCCLVTNVSTDNCLPLPQFSRPIAVAPKETMLVYLNGAKLYLYDIAKNNSTELATVR